jgi:hypothetical protein
VTPGDQTGRDSGRALAQPCTEHMTVPGTSRDIQVPADLPGQREAGFTMTRNRGGPTGAETPAAVAAARVQQHRVVLSPMPFNIPARHPAMISSTGSLPTPAASG